LNKVVGKFTYFLTLNVNITIKTIVSQGKKRGNKKEGGCRAHPLCMKLSCVYHMRGENMVGEIIPHLLDDLF
jgi:hypothetical protein